MKNTSTLFAFLAVAGIAAAAYASATNAEENAILDARTNVALDMGLSTTTPAEAGTGCTEPSGNGYARQGVAAADWAAASGGSISTSSPVDFGDPTGSWGTITHFCLYEDSTNTVLYYGALGSSISPDAATTSVTVTPTLTVD